MPLIDTVGPLTRWRNCTLRPNLRNLRSLRIFFLCGLCGSVVKLFRHERLGHIVSGREACFCG